MKYEFEPLDVLLVILGCTALYALISLGVTIYALVSIFT